MNKRRIIKNLLVISFGFLFFFSALLGQANIQSTINKEGGLGLYSQMVVFASIMISTMLLSLSLIKRFGCRLTMVVSILMSFPYMAANFYPVWGTLIPTAFVMGLANGQLFSAMSIYVNEISVLYVAFVDDPLEVVNARFFSIFRLFYQTTEIWGNLVSSYVLTPNNDTEYISTEDAAKRECGASVCYEKQEYNDTRDDIYSVSDEKRNIIMGIYLGFLFLAGLIMWIFLDPLPRQDDDKTEKVSFSSEHLVITFKHLRKLNQVLLIPISIFCGLEKGYYIGDYTKAYIACSWGVHHVGYVTICYGIVSALLSCMLGTLVKYLTQIPIFLFAAAGNIAMCIWMFLWQPSPEQPVIFYVIAGIWGMADVIWWSQIPAFCGILFAKDEEAAFSNFYFWSSLGYVMAFGYSNSLCVSHKLYILLSFVIVGTLGYLLVVFRTRKTTKSEKS